LKLVERNHVAPVQNAILGERIRSGDRNPVADRAHGAVLRPFGDRVDDRGVVAAVAASRADHALGAALGPPLLLWTTGASVVTFACVWQSCDYEQK
jgi:hypothetical protein